jgi:hypothetical protein
MTGPKVIIVDVFVFDTPPRQLAYFYGRTRGDYPQPKLL